MKDDGSNETFKTLMDTLMAYKLLNIKPSSQSVKNTSLSLTLKYYLINLK